MRTSPAVSSLLIILLATFAAPAQQPARDHFGDPLPDGAVLRLGTARLRHGGPVSYLAFSPDGSLLVSVGGENTLSVWDVATGSRRFRTWASPLGSPPARFTDDGRALVLLDEAGGVWHLDVAT